jgi:hypothetical protein
MLERLSSNKKQAIMELNFSSTAIPQMNNEPEKKKGSSRRKGKANTDVNATSLPLLTPVFKQIRRRAFYEKSQVERDVLPKNLTRKELDLKFQQILHD